MKVAAVARQELDEARFRTSIKDKLGARGLWLPGGALILIFCVGFVFVRQSSTLEGRVSAIPTFEVQEGPLLISVLESGTISAREQRIIKSEVEGQKQITWLIPEGEHVKEGDLLVQLDSGSFEYQLLTQQIEVQSAEADFIEARENLAIQKLNSESTVSAAKLRLQFAAEDLTKYIEGDFPLDLKGAEAQLILAIAELASAEQDLGGRKRLFEKDFVTVRELEAAERLQQKAQLDLELAESNIELLKSFTYDRRLAQLESDKEEAERALARAHLETASWMVQSEGNVTNRTAQLQHKQKKLRKIEEQIDKCEIYAPTGGMVVYATSSKGGGRMGQQEPLREGQMVHERQELIYLPTAKAVMARITIHESNLAKVRPGLGVRITVDALPGREFTGRVATIAQLPDAMSMYLNPDLKVYDTEIYIDGDGSGLRTGMSCLARIMVERYEHAVYVPVQSVVLTKAGHIVHVLKGNETEERLVDVGLDNNRMIRIASNLKAGERVLLAPPEAPTTMGDEDLLETFIEASAPPEIEHRVVKVLDTTGANGSEDRRRGVGKMTPEQMQEMRMRYEDMSPEEQEEAKQRLSGGGDGGMDGKGARDSDAK